MEKLSRIYFIGIGGIGMSALARYFKSRGLSVAGYDKTETPLTKELSGEGIIVHYEDDIESIPPEYRLATADKSSTLVVYTPAVPKDHTGLNYFRDNGYEIRKRAEVLGMITMDSYTVAVAGTHGKTTTSSMIAHLLIHAGYNCTAFLGGITKNYNTNFIAGNKDQGKSIVVVEADEYDRSFLTLSPDLSVITSMDADHLDIYGDKNYMEESYKLFAGRLKQGGKLFYHTGLPLSGLNLNHAAYGTQGDADYSASNVRIQDHRYHFDWKNKTSIIKDITSDLPGWHNVENAVAAIALARHIGLDDAQIRDGMASYLGVKRRFDIQVKGKSVVYIDDYAHHPEELRACITSVRELYPGKKILGIFQPHLYTRTRDFVDGFAQSLSLLDELIMLDIYPARELPIPGVSSRMILDKMTLKAWKLCKKEEVLKELGSSNFDVVLTLGAGDIDQLVGPVRDYLLTKRM